MTLARERNGGPWQARIDATPWGEREQALLRSAIVDSHCGELPERAVPAIAYAQRVRDAAMAQATAEAAKAAGSAVLLAGDGHVRRDIGAPRYLLPAELPHGESDIVSIAFIEASADEMRSSSFPHDALADNPGYDFVWFTPPASRPDPCESLRRRPPRGP
jgi:uncharacterized iron-regulated protein